MLKIDLRLQQEVVKPYKNKITDVWLKYHIKMYHKTSFEFVCSSTTRVCSSHFLKVTSKMPCSSHLLQENNYHQIRAYPFMLNSVQVRVVDNWAHVILILDFWRVSLCP